MFDNFFWYNLFVKLKCQGIVDISGVSHLQSKDVLLPDEVFLFQYLVCVPHISVESEYMYAANNKVATGTSR